MFLTKLLIIIYVFVFRFIGEIYKQLLLSPYVIHYCIKMLIICETKERSLEYLCNLLKVAGKELNEKVFLFFICY